MLQLYMHGRSPPPGHAMVTADELRTHRDRHKATNHETYRQIFTSVSDSLRYRAEADPTALWTAVSVPLWLPGRPPYDHDHALNYVQRKLEVNGFDVRRGTGAEEGVLLVSWKATAEPPKPKQPGGSGSSRTLPNPDAARHASASESELYRFSASSPSVAAAFRTLQDIKSKLR